MESGTRHRSERLSTTAMAIACRSHSTFTGSAPTPNNYLFAGEQFDPDLNPYYNRARYLNVSTRRFLVCRYLRRRPAVAIVIAQVSLH